MITQVTATYKHKKTGGYYMVAALAKMQAEFWSEPTSGDEWESVDKADVVVYFSLQDKSWWVRPQSEFEDGRFEKV